MSEQPENLKTRGLGKYWNPLRWIFLLGGIALLAYLVSRVGLATLVEHALRAGWSFLAILAVYGVAHLLRTVSWRFCLGEERGKLSFGRALALWLAGDALGHLSVGWSAEAFRSAALRKQIPVAKALSSMVVSRMFYAYASLLVTATGLSLALLLYSAGPTRSVVTTALVILLALLVLPLGWGSSAFWFFRKLNTRLEHHPPRSLLGRIHHFLRHLGNNLLHIFGQEKRKLYTLFGINLLASLAGVVEIYLLLLALAPPKTSLATAIVVEAGSKLISMAAFIIPGNVGVREGGIVLLLQPFGIAASVGVALALLRRGRAFFWIALGLVVMMVYGLRPAAGALETPSPEHLQN